MRKLFVISALAALTGCASLQEVNDSLRKTNAALSGASSRQAGKLGDGSGYQPVLNIAVPGGVCHQQAFMDGFKDSYLLNWNQFVGTKVAHYTAETMKPNHSAAAKKNLALYQSRVIGAKKYIGHAMTYQLDASSLNANNCPYQSYQKGQSAGMNAVSADWKDLVAQEL